ncbi:TrmJ/YjtD family RNA methyltransferase [Enterovirga sp. GCM10030262]|uniref:TrmJ/YjtD family RNA methyltransferase n=1 Tax=Enterovirga sp. GCM10030262 TaxID=3273391 RepID=UPI00360A3553
MSFWTYILRLSNGIYYTGHTDDLDRRIAEHRSGAIKRYTHDKRPLEFMWADEFPTRAEALEAELKIKKWSRAKKEALIAADWDKLSHFAVPPGERNRRTSASLGGVPRLRSGRTEVRDHPRQSVRVERSRDTLPSEAEGRIDTVTHPAPPAIVLVRPQLGENIGKAARAMLNFGLTDLRLVTPRDGWPNPSAGPAASGADSVLEKARVFGSVAEAVADCPFVYATTVRKRGLVIPVVSPEETAREIRANAGPSAILFGAERSGLETEEVAVAQKIVTVPINPEFRSLNLAQAVILVAYEWSKHADLMIPTEGDPAEPRAAQEQLEGLIGQMDEALAAAGYYYPPDRVRVTKNTMRTILSKAGWSNREIQALRGMIRALVNPRQR